VVILDSRTSYVPVLLVHKFLLVYRIMGGSTPVCVYMDTHELFVIKRHFLSSFHNFKTMFQVIRGIYYVKSY